MSTRSLRRLIVDLTIVSLSVAATQTNAQHSFTNTVTVDPSGNADQTTIQGAIIALGTPNVRSTVLIYAGEYDEAVTLDENDENIDLLGADGQAVIIKPTGDDEDGITITSGTETARNNAIRNLTIITTDGHGIKIVRGGGGTAPKGITIEGVTIQANGTDKDGISASEVDTFRVFDTTITTADGHGIEFLKPSSTAPTNIELELVTIAADGTSNYGILADDATNGSISNCSIVSDNHHGVETGDTWTILNTMAEGKTGAYGFRILGDSSRMFGCRGIGVAAGLSAGGSTCTIESSFFTGGTGVVIGEATDVTLLDCDVVAHHDLASGAIKGIVSDASLNDNIMVKGCRISATSDGTLAIGIWHDIKTMRIEDCRIIAINEKTDGEGGEGDALGIRGAGTGTTTVVGGSIETSSASDKEFEVFDLKKGNGTLKMAGTSLSKWQGNIEPASVPVSSLQRTINIAVPSATGILGVTSLTGSEQEITAGITEPDVYRVLSVTGSAGTTQDVYIIGTNFAGDTITEKFILTGATEVDGERPFATVTKIILPAQSSGDQTVSVGTTSIMGLQFPISATADVLEQARKGSAATSYTLQTVGTVDTEFATVDIGTIVANDSLEWVVLASK